jgi:hypothetical protein
MMVSWLMQLLHTKQSRRKVLYSNDVELVPSVLTLSNYITMKRGKKSISATVLSSDLHMAGKGKPSPMQNGMHGSLKRRQPSSLNIS